MSKDMVVASEGDSAADMPPQNILENFAQVSVPVKRKLEETEESEPAVPSTKRRSQSSEEESVPLASNDSNSSCSLQMEKRKCDDEEAAQSKKLCQPIGSYAELAEDGRSACGGEEQLRQPCTDSYMDSGAVPGSPELRCMQQLAESPHFDSILAATLLSARQTDCDMVAKAGAAAAVDIGKERTTGSSPRVVVEHQPVLPAIYELGQMLSMRGNFDVGDDEEEEVADSESEDDDEEEEDHSMFDTPPKHHFDRFWPVVSTPPSSTTSAATPVVVPPPSGLLTPPMSPTRPSSSSSISSSSVATTTTTNSSGNTYQFLDQTSQRIECDENGKSYLQLGTVSHHHNHHLPVTPVIQPKPLVVNPRRNSTPAPLLPSCRPLLTQRGTTAHGGPSPPCHHAGGRGGMGLFGTFRRTAPYLAASQQQQLSTTRRCSPCYRQQRSDMLSLSLHKLHAARQRSDSSLRRSVLICNMLRYIEDESSTEQREEQEAAAVQQQQQISFHHHNHHQQHNSANSHHQEQTLEQQQQSYWANQMAGFVAAPPTPNPYRDGAGSVAGCASGGGGGGFSTSSAEPISVVNGFDAPLKDFNSAFRQTPIPPPPPGPSDLSEEEERNGGGGINWSSVLSLSSQTELDPLNNNTYTDSGHHHSLWSSSVSDMPDMDLSHHSFDDISWKLSPVSADEVMKAFPDENLFQCAA